MDNFRIFSQRRIATFATKDEAMDWLVED